MEERKVKERLQNRKRRGERTSEEASRLADGANGAVRLMTTCDLVATFQLLSCAATDCVHQTRSSTSRFSSV